MINKFRPPNVFAIEHTMVNWLSPQNDSTTQKGERQQETLNKSRHIIKQVGGTIYFKFIQRGEWQQKTLNKSSETYYQTTWMHNASQI